MSFLRLPTFGRGKGRNDTPPSVADDTRPTLNLHVPAFGGVVMKPLSDPSGSTVNEPTILAGQVEIYLPTDHGFICKGLSVWIEARWIDVEGKKDKGRTVCWEQKAVIDCSDHEPFWLEPGRQRIALPATLPRNCNTPIGRLMYWLVGNIEGLPDGHSPPVIQSRTTRSTNPASSSSSREPSTSTPPPYSIPESESSDAKWLRGSVRSERRIALSHNPNPDGGVSRLDDDFTHDLPGFGTCRVQVRVNEWCVGCRFPLRLTCLALSPLATLFSIRVKLVATTIITPPPTGRSMTTKDAFTIIEHGQIPQHLSMSPASDFPALWRGSQAGGQDVGDLMADVSGKLPFCDQLIPTTLPGIHMPGIGVPIRASHKLVYEIFFSVFGETGEGKKMPSPGQGGIQLMRRVIDVVLPQCVFVSEVLNLPSYSTVFGENIRRTDEYFYHRIEANLPCPTCNTIPLHNLCTDCPGDIASHVQHSMPPPLAFAGEGSNGSNGSAKKRPRPISFDPSRESCPTCSGKSVLPGEDPNYHLCGCEIEGRDAAYHFVWDEAGSTVVKEVTA